ncbi:MAG: RNA-binding protein [Verrucomicrobiota bacterium]
MSNATQDSRNSGGDSRRRRSRGGQNRNNNNNERRSGGGGERGERGPRDSRNDNRGQSQGRQSSSRAEEFRPQAPRPARTYAPVKLSFWQKILKAIGLYKEPAPPARAERTERPERGERSERKPESTPFPSGDRAPKSNTRNARSGEGEAREPREPRPPREPRAEGERQPKERAPRNNDRPRGGDPKSVESTRVYVGNLSYDVSEQDLQELFKGIGGVRNIEIVYNRSTHRSKGYGFVEMLRMDEAMRAVEVLHDQPFMGRKMTVSGAKSKGQDEREDMEERDRPEPKKVVLASTAPPVVAAVAAESTIETIVESIAAPVEEVPAVAETVVDLQAKYGFDEQPSVKTEEA